MTVELTRAQALAVRMTSLLLHPGDAGPDGTPDSVAGVVTWFGAMQAQDLASGLWSLGARLPRFDLTDVNAALERREALRTWPMRGTVHLVPPRDARWMLDLMGVRALAGATKRRAYLGLTEQVATKAVDVLGQALAGGGRLTRAQCLARLASSGVDSGGQLGYHLLWYASQCGVTCIAPNIGTEQTFALLDEWAPQPYLPERDEALGLIALRYFRSHGPAPVQDLAGWTGLPISDARRGVAAAGAALSTVRVDGRECVLTAAALAGYGSRPSTLDTTDVRALPGFDEYLLGYKDRVLMLDDEHKQAIIPGGNGVFQATIVQAGRVVGTWKRSVARTRVVVTVAPLVPLRPAQRRRVEAALVPYGRFLGLTLQVRWP